MDFTPRSVGTFRRPLAEPLDFLFLVFMVFNALNSVSFTVQLAPARPARLHADWDWQAVSCLASVGGAPVTAARPADDDNRQCGQDKFRVALRPTGGQTTTNEARGRHRAGTSETKPTDRELI
jgi:hypothetical protein